MKILRFVLFVLITTFVASHAQPSEWVYMGTDDVIGIQWSCDLETLTESPQGIMKVWVLKEYSEEVRTKEMQWRMNEGLGLKGYERLSHSFSLCEVNCTSHEYRLMQIFYHTADGQVIYSHDYQRQPAEGWRRAPPGTIADKLHETLCPPEEMKQ